METILMRSLSLFVLLQGSVYWNTCNGWIRLCEDDTHSIHNGSTIIVETNGPVSVLVCVFSNMTVHNYVRIKQQNREVYLLTVHEDTLNQKMVRGYKQTTVNLTIYNKEFLLLKEMISVNIFTEDKSVNYKDLVVFTFILDKRPDSVISKETTLIGQVKYSNTAALPIAPTTSTTTPVTSTTAATTPSKGNTSWTTKTAVTTTDISPWCQGRNDSGCPKFWNPVDKEMCLNIIAGARNVTPEDQCAEFGAQLPDDRNLNNIKPCVKYLLQAAPVSTLYVNETTYLSVQNWTSITHRRSYRVACLLDKQQFALPVIKSFSLERWNYTGPTLIGSTNLLASNFPHVSIQATNDTLNLTCKASGYPKPEVIIRRDNVTLEQYTPGTSQIRSMNYDHTSIFTCYAKNFLNSAVAHQTIRISVSEDHLGESSHQENTSTEVTHILFIVLPVAFLIIIVFFILGVLLYRHRAKLLSRASERSNITNDTSGQVTYANLRELVSGSSAQETQVELNQEMRIENSDENVFPSDLTDQDSGRIISEEGLVYITVVHAANLVKKKPKQAKNKPKLVDTGPKDHVVYMTLDFQKNWHSRKHRTGRRRKRGHKERDGGHRKI